MRFDDRFLDELKSRLRLSDVIGRTVKLRRQGREFVGLSPFNQEKSPSFFVNDDKGFFHDFSSGKHGDLITFLQETERLSFFEAVERLAGEAGMALPEPDPQAAVVEKRRQSLTDWLEAAAAWCETQLSRPVGAEARAYLERRGLPQSEWSRFRLGYAPSGRTAMKDALVAKGALPRDLVAAGLSIAPEDGGETYDRFRDRLIFPIVDGRGRVVSLGGRALDPKARAKYLNGPDTDLFDKGRVLYGLPEARRLLLSGGDAAPLLVVEGYMDVIACQRAGLAAVAPMGTALTEGQMEALWRLHGEPTLCFDGDRAGRQAAARAMDRALPLLKPGRSFRFSTVTGGKDPDDVLREQGPAALREQLTRTTPFVEALFMRERDMGPLDTPEQRAGLKQRLRNLAKGIADPDLAAAYRDDLLARLQMLIAPQRSAERGLARTAGRGRGWRDGRGEAPLTPALEASRLAAGRLAAALDPLACALALKAIQDPVVVDPQIEGLQAHGFGDPALEDLCREIIRVRLDFDHLDSIALRRHLTETGFGALLNDVDRAAAHSGAPFIRDDVPSAAARSQWSQVLEVMHHLAAAEEAFTLAKASLVGSSDASELMALKKQRDYLRRAIRSGSVWSGEDPS